MLSKLNAHKNQKGFTLIELLIVIAIIGILAAVAIPQFSAYRDRANGAAAQSDLHNVYLSCKAFWGDNTPTTACTETLIGGVLYGFVSSNNVTLGFTNGTEAAFVVTAVHASTPTVTYTVNSAGAITSGATP